MGVKYKIKEIKKRYIRRLASSSDLHLLSAKSLMPDSITLDDGQIIKSSPEQKLLWSFWEDFNDQCDELEIDTIIFNGDIVHGDNYKGSGLGVLSSDLGVQSQVSTDTLRRSCKGRKSLIMEGSQYHTSTHGSNHRLEEQICKRLKAEGFDCYWGGKSLDLEVSPLGKLIQVRHAIGNSEASAEKEVWFSDAAKGVGKVENMIFFLEHIGITIN
jgi:hypothetical protein